MISYQDRCFCAFKDCAKFNDCHRALTDEINEAATKAEMPIARFANKPECYEEKDESNV